MLKIIHRINTVEGLKKIPKKYGVEIDIRAYRDRLILNHEPFNKGEHLEKYLAHFKHAFVIFNIKEAGIESEVLKLAQQFKIKNYFLLDVEFPYLYRAARDGIKNIAIRYSEDESLETVLKYKGMVDWIWIDTNTRLPLNKAVVKKLAGFKTCLVCPERWGRPKDIAKYRQKMKKISFQPHAVMTSLKTLSQWED